MNTDLISIAIRIIMMFFLTLTSELAIRLRSFALGFFLFTLWLTFFRLTMYRAVSSYAGIFNHETVLAKDITAWLLSSSTSNFTDFLLLIGLLGLFFHVKSLYQRQGGEK